MRSPTLCSDGIDYSDPDTWLHCCFQENSSGDIYYSRSTDIVEPSWDSPYEVSEDEAVGWISPSQAMTYADEWLYIIFRNTDYDVWVAKKSVNNQTVFMKDIASYSDHDLYGASIAAYEENVLAVFYTNYGDDLDLAYDYSTDNGETWNAAYYYFYVVGTDERMPGCDVSQAGEFCVMYTQSGENILWKETVEMPPVWQGGVAEEGHYSDYFQVATVAPYAPGAGSWHEVTTTYFAWCYEPIQEEEVVDQSQTADNYGFWFDDAAMRWQEFFPTLNNLSAVEVLIHKAGSPGDINIQIYTQGGDLVGQQTIPEADVPYYDWARADFDPRPPLIPGNSYLLFVNSSEDSPSPDNRYFWQGNTDSDYPGETDVYDNLPNFDYAFITYGFIQTGIEDVDIENMPEQISLSQNYPNPFNAKTIIKFELLQQSPILIDIYNILGHKVETLVNDIRPAGYNQVTWNADDFSSGIYFYRIQAGTYAETKKMLLIK